MSVYMSTIYNSEIPIQSNAQVLLKVFERFTRIPVEEYTVGYKVYYIDLHVYIFKQVLVYCLHKYFLFKSLL